MGAARPPVLCPPSPRQGAHLRGLRRHFSAQPRRQLSTFRTSALPGGRAAAASALSWGRARESCGRAAPGECGAAAAPAPGRSSSRRLRPPRGEASRRRDPRRAGMAAAGRGDCRTRTRPRYLPLRRPRLGLLGTERAEGTCGGTAAAGAQRQGDCVGTRAGTGLPQVLAPSGAGREPRRWPRWGPISLSGAHRAVSSLGSIPTRTGRLLAAERAKRNSPLGASLQGAAPDSALLSGSSVRCRAAPLPAGSGASAERSSDKLTQVRWQGWQQCPAAAAALPSPTAAWHMPGFTSEGCFLLPGGDDHRFWGPSAAALKSCTTAPGQLFSPGATEFRGRKLHHRRIYNHSHELKVFPFVQLFGFFNA